ncbi:MAG TPA: thymidine phosphorylase [Ignavibacteriaceae bacterium]|nr:thymidine phosphorylase [Ignavibacteriaceae bacterium]
MNIVEIIRKKRNKEELTKEEVLYLVKSFTKGKIPDYQFSAFLMAVYFSGMNTIETAALTEAMLYSGKVIDLSLIPGFKIDKHSTGGVGDKTSLIIAPIVAAAGALVPMISGRGLGHTGGTLDKLESVPGFRTSLSLSDYKLVVKKCGAVLIGQTKDIAPADKLIYALRDVTATVESIPLITSSIMSKKLAEGIDGLVLDVKTGSGAFMRELKDAEELASSLLNTTKSFNKKVTAFITDMNQPLGNNIGNWLEILECIDILKGEKENDLLELSLNLAGSMLNLAGKADSLEEGIELSKQMISSGKAYSKFMDIIKYQGGDLKYINNPSLYPSPRFTEDLIAEEDGYLCSTDCYQFGMASLELGAGRMTKEDDIDPKAGIIFNKKIGDKVKKGEVIGHLFSDVRNKIDKAKGRLTGAMEFSNSKCKKPELIKKII